VLLALALAIVLVPWLLAIPVALTLVWFAIALLIRAAKLGRLLRSNRKAAEAEQKSREAAAPASEPAP
jgi:membrane protein implicated in regulation of membrane protease activity